MAIKKCVSIFFVHAILVLFTLKVADAQSLQLGFYEKQCPGVEVLIAKTTAKYIFKAPSFAASLLRMYFHDCFVKGCDGSILLNSTTTIQAEKVSPPNRSLRGYEIVNAVKSVVEKRCPGIVSCADILALVARDAVSMIHGPFWPVPTGRRDGGPSTFIDALINLPPPFANITTLKGMFAAKGLNVKDLAVLSGAHTIGLSQCTSFTNRLYNFTGKGDTDPSLDPNYIVQLKRKCKPNDIKTTVEMDPGSALKFDEHYYTLVTKHKGLFESDAALLNDVSTRAYVKLQSKTFGSTFDSDFANSMVKMGQIGILTGNSGEIRKICSAIN